MPSEVGASLGFGAGGNGKKSGSFGVNSGSSNRDSAWVNDMTEITGVNVDIAVAGKTSITGAMIDGDNNLHLTTNELEFKDLHDFERVGETGFGVSTSVGFSTDKEKTALHPNGETSLTLEDTGSDKEQITHATIGAGVIEVGGKVADEAELSGLNRDTTKAQEITKDLTTGTLDATASIDNRVFTNEGRAEIAREHEGLGENLSQIGNGLRNNIITKTIENTRTGDKSLSENFYDYVEQDRQMTELKENRKDLMLALNGMTNFDSEEAKNILQQIADLTAGENGFSGKLQLANVEGNIAGFSYQSNDGEIKNITINLANVDLTKPNELMNVIYHETTNFEEHSRKEQNAINRGKTGAGIFSLKNFGNENTNGMSKTDWIIANADKDTISNGTLGLVSDLYNTATKKGEGEPQVVTATATVGTAVVASGIALATAKFIKDVKDLLSDTLFNSDNSSGQEPENMNNDNGGDKDPNSWCAKHPKLCLDLNKLSSQDKKSIKTYEKRIQEHKEKLEKFKNNPTIKPGMENRSPNEIKLQQERRIKHLQHEIDVFEENIKKILGGK